MLVNGRPRQACTTFVDEVSPKGAVIALQPLSKFPVVRDLVVDRSRTGAAILTTKSWAEIDGTRARGAGPLRESPAEQAARYSLASCIGCCACLEACPEYQEHKPFVGAVAINDVRLASLHPSEASQGSARVASLMGEGGVQDCGKAQNCVEVCPKSIPLVDSIGHMQRQATKRFLFGWILGAD
jgi:succinate dehydrogenase / fumarate reductase iron-sulfur subunit